MSSPSANRFAGAGCSGMCGGSETCGEIRVDAPSPEPAVVCCIRTRGRKRTSSVARVKIRYTRRREATGTTWVPGCCADTGGHFNTLSARRGRAGGEMVGGGKMKKKLRPLTALSFPDASTFRNGKRRL
ncbi:hypothetical protein B0H11DRAFT_1939841 [Mycena galericulata]|nr:hypothetical protein B0H11DRAFT_1939841 [Mycena galericulata]